MLLRGRVWAAALPVDEGSTPTKTMSVRGDGNPTHDCDISMSTALTDDNLCFGSIIVCRSVESGYCVAAEMDLNGWYEDDGKSAWICDSASDTDKGVQWETVDGVLQASATFRAECAPARYWGFAPEATWTWGYDV